MKKKKTLDGIRFNQPATSLAIRHMAANSNSCCSKNTGREQQQQRQQQHPAYIYKPGISYAAHYTTGYVRYTENKLISRWNSKPPWTDSQRVSPTRLPTEILMP